MTNSKINVTDLDFDQIKNNLKEYLRGQSEFTDYDFEGSALSTLLDVLAYNTHYQSLYYNLVVNESFLDSASKRSSVVSKAHELGYTPKSISSAKAYVNIVMINNQLSAPDIIEIPKYSPFTANIDGSTYTFYSTETHLAQRDGSVYTFPNVIIREGTPLSYQYVINESNTRAVIIPNLNVDADTILVKVQESAEVVDFSTFVQSDTILNISGTSKVFFLKELASGQHQLQFGNDVIGQALKPGNIVTIEYFVSKGSLANGCRSFSYGGPLLPNTTVSVLTINPAFGGSEGESIEDIRYNAPRFYTSQNRCVTVEDYRSTITMMYPLVKSVNVWGGEDNDPPSYGTIFVCPVSQNGQALAESEKNELLSSVINPRKSITTKIVIVDPDFMDVELAVSFYYNASLTTKTSTDLSKLVQDSILRYNNDYLNIFSGILKYSHLSRLIDDSDDAIISNIMTLKSRVYITPNYNQISSYKININNPIFNSGIAGESVLSDGIVTSLSPQLCYIDDAPVAGSTVGNLRLFYIENNIKRIVNSNVGSVDYSTGVITISNINIISSINTQVALTVKTDSNDIVSMKNRIVRIDPIKLSITPIIQSNYTDYQFTSSRK